MAKYIREPRNVLPNGLTLVQIRPDRAVDLVQESRTFGWLFSPGWEPGQWITDRRLSPLEIEEAYEQSADMNVLDAGGST